MGTADILRYRVLVARDPETGCAVPMVPALGVADQGADTPETQVNIKAMVAFQVECLQGEGEPTPRHKGTA